MNSYNIMILSYLYRDTVVALLQHNCGTQQWKDIIQYCVKKTNTDTLTMLIKEMPGMLFYRYILYQRLLNCIMYLCKLTLHRQFLTLCH